MKNFNTFFFKNISGFFRNIKNHSFYIFRSIFDCANNLVQYINLFLEVKDNTRWADDDEMNNLFARRLEGEAYGLRGMFFYYLLRSHAGFSSDGQLLGIPLTLKYLTSQSPKEEFNQPRATFQACVEQIYSDLSKAEELLPLEYEDVSTVPADFQNITSDASKYNNVMGAKARLLFNGLIARAYRARTALLAASPLYQDASNLVTWADAADAAFLLKPAEGGIGEVRDIPAYKKIYEINVRHGRTGGCGGAGLQVVPVVRRQGDA